MKNKKGFTLIEVLAVIVLLGILVSVATVGVSKYRKDVDEKERYSIRQTIKAAFTNYRIMNDVSPEEHKGEDALGNEEEIMKLLKFDGGNTLKYGGEKCVIGADSKVLFLINGTSKYQANIKNISKKDILDLCSDEDTEDKCYAKYYAKYKICELDTTGSCKEGFVPSKMETVCIKLSCNGNVIINDFEDSNSLCYKDITGIS